VGCGIATDGLQFLRAGARYTGFDQSPVALGLARRRFELEGLAAEDLVQSTAVELPFADESFDLVFSHGVIHHIADTAGVVAEFKRVLRPGGTALVMVYHRDSFNYYVNIMGLRRALAALLLIPGAPKAIAGATGESEELLLDHRALLRDHGLDYLRDRELFLAHNTDGPGNPLSKVYSRDEGRELFRDFADVAIAIRHLNLRVIPGGGALAETATAEALGRRAGWHLYLRARKGHEGGRG
jgi:SAM-dependent methyltransferase